MTLKINSVRPLIIRSMCIKFDGPSWNGSVCIVFTTFADKPTDRRPDRQTDRQTPAPYHNTSRQVGHIITTNELVAIMVNLMKVPLFYTKDSFLRVIWVKGAEVNIKTYGNRKRFLK